MRRAIAAVLRERLRDFFFALVFFFFFVFVFFFFVFVLVFFFLALAAPPVLAAPLPLPAAALLPAPPFAWSPPGSAMPSLIAPSTSRSLFFSATSIDWAMTLLSPATDGMKVRKKIASFAP